MPGESPSGMCLRSAVFVRAGAASEEAPLALVTPASQRVVLTVETHGVLAGPLRHQPLQLRAAHLTKLRPVATVKLSSQRLI